jgi:UDPglucose 6-dehydrogenase
MIEALLAKGASVCASDPAALENAKAHFGNRIELSEDPYAVLEGVDGLFVVTEWPEFRRPDFLRMKSLMREAVLFDGRNIYEPDAMRGLGFHYYSIGRRAM